MAVGIKLGVLGGTFNPIHLGHLKIAEEVTNEFSLNKVLFIPAGQPWLKSNSTILEAKHRVEMVKLAINDKVHFKLSMLEIDRNGPSYTVDTLEQLHHYYNKVAIYFILGWDNLAQLPLWHKPQRIVQLCHLVVVPRVDYPFPDLAFLGKKIPNISQVTTILNSPCIDINSSVIRERIRQGLPINRLVPKRVYKYITEKKLYQ